jgi:hypothetical protein
MYKFKFRASIDIDDYQFVVPVKVLYENNYLIYLSDIEDTHIGKLTFITLKYLSKSMNKLGFVYDTDIKAFISHDLKYLQQQTKFNDIHGTPIFDGDIICGQIIHKMKTFTNLNMREQIEQNTPKDNEVLVFDQDEESFFKSEIKNFVIDHKWGNCETWFLDALVISDFVFEVIGNTAEGEWC